MGRGKRTRLSLGDGSGRERTLPDGLRQALSRKPDDYDFTVLRRLSGRFVDGYSDEDVSAVSALLAKAVGLPLCVVWDYRRDGFCAGAAEEFLLKEGALYELPEALSDLLFEPLGVVPEADELARQLVELAPSALVLDQLTAVDAANYVVEDRDA